MNGIHRYLDHVNVTNAFVVSTNAAIYYDIPEGAQVIVHTVNYGVDDANKEVEIYIVGCAAVAGGGAATQHMHHWEASHGDKKQGRVYLIEHLDQPVIIRYSSGYRSVSLAVKATDAQTDVTYGWCGWVEREIT